MRFRARARVDRVPLMGTAGRHTKLVTNQTWNAYETDDQTGLTSDHEPDPVPYREALADWMRHLKQRDGTR